MVESRCPEAMVESFILHSSAGSLLKEDA